MTRILMVEDNELNRALVRAIISRTSEAMVKGAELIEAHNLAQARAVLSETQIDVILLDVQLPDGSGLSLLEWLPQAAGQARRPAVIAVTGGVLPEQRAEAEAAGVDAIVDKPFSATEFVAVIAKNLPK